MPESNEQVVERLRAMREARKARQTPVASSGPVPPPPPEKCRCDRNGGRITITDPEELPTIVEIMNALDRSYRTVKLTYLGWNYYFGPGDPSKTAEEQEWSVNIEIVAPISFDDAPMIRWHEEPVPQATKDLLARLTDVCQLTGPEEEFRKRLKNISDEGWLFDVNAADVGLTIEQAIAVTRRWAVVTGSRAVARFKDAEEAIFFDPENDFYKALDHTGDFGWDFDFQRAAMGIQPDEAQDILNRWLRERRYSV
jgi:hypothetical protein